MSRLPPAAAFAQPLALSVSLQGGALFTKNEPTLTHNGPESRVYLKVHACYCTIFGFGQMYNDTAIIIITYGYFQCPKNSLCSAWLFCPAIASPGNHSSSYSLHLSPSVAKSCLTLCSPMNCGTPGSSVLHRLLEFAQIRVLESVMPSKHLMLCHPLLLPPSIFPSIRVFSNESVLCIRWPKYWSFSISLFNEYSGLISFRIDWFDLLAVQGTLKSPNTTLQKHQFFSTQLSLSSNTHSYITTGKILEKILEKYLNSQYYIGRIVGSHLNSSDS